MKTHFILTLCALILLAGCRKKESYTELDQAVSAKLVESGIPGVFVTDISVNETVDTSNVAFHCARACADIKNYFQYVTYPYTICTPPDFVVNENIVATARRMKHDSILPMLSDTVKFTHKVTGETRFGAYKSLFCKTVGGPWGATLEDREFCGFCGDAPHQYTMVIGGLPGTPTWVWWGTMADKPADAPAFNTGGNSLSNSVTIDCNPNDLTNCSGSPGGGGSPQ